MAREFARAFYNSKQWKETQRAFMTSKNYVCERCGALGTVAHHRRYLRPDNINDPNVTLNWDNLECLCAECHANEHALKYNKITFDDNGDIASVKDNGAIKEHKKQTQLIDRLLQQLKNEQK